ncbi:MAG TPA: phosphoglycerate kinase [Dehalococcoidia bacterium]|nr:phosphoglycerate kinase [Dehalococcoidia bacterium]
MPAAGKKTIEDVELQGSRVLVRVDFNVPTTGSVASGSVQISDDSRIRAVLPTVEYLRDRACRVMLCSHMGRPDGEVDPDLRLTPIRDRLSELLGVEVLDARGPAGRVPVMVMESMAAGDVALLENLRFNKREERNDGGFARKLSALGDVFVNDAFGTAHRAHASTVGVAEQMPAVAGLLMARELEMLGACLESPERPVVAVIGGAKVSDKIAVLTHLAGVMDTVLVGGGMVSAFLAASGSIDADPVDFAEIEAARSLLRDSEARIVIPADVVTAMEFSKDAEPTTTGIPEISDGALVLDIGPDSVARYAEEIARAKTVIWNGPMGVFEWPAFAAGTTSVAQAIAANDDCVNVVGGGSTAEAVGALGLRDRFTHVSTGGGASLEYLEGKTLPGVAALLDAVEPELAVANESED